MKYFRKIQDVERMQKKRKKRSNLFLTLSGGCLLADIDNFMAPQTCHF